MPKLILIKHSQPVLDPDVPSPRWVLSEDGRARCAWLATALKAKGVARLCSSLEPKALETAALVAMRLGLAVEPCEGLHENDRTGQGFTTEAVLQQSIRDFFARPADVAMGRESLNAALERYSAAVAAVVRTAPASHVAVVTHGTVLTAFVARHNPIQPFAFWSGLTTPSYIALDSATFALKAQPVLYPKPSAP